MQIRMFTSKMILQMFFFPSSFLTFALGLSQTSGSGGMAFQGLMYASSYDHLAVPLMPRDTVSVVSSNPELLEEVKDVLIPAEKLRIEDGKIIGKGKSLIFTCFHNVNSSTFVVSFIHCFFSHRSLWDCLSRIPGR